MERKNKPEVLAVVPLLSAEQRRRREPPSPKANVKPPIQRPGSRVRG